MAGNVLGNVTGTSWWAMPSRVDPCVHTGAVEASSWKENVQHPLFWDVERWLFERDVEK
jgi:hypothetical protein